jgi:hypothetical protein
MDAIEREVTPEERRRRREDNVEGWRIQVGNLLDYVGTTG